MKCEKIQELAADYLMNALGESELMEFEQHLSECSACRKEVEEMEQLWIKMGVV